MKEIQELIDKMPEGESKAKAQKALVIAEVLLTQAERVAKICQTELSDADKFELALTGEITRHQIKTIIETPIHEYHAGGISFGYFCEHEFTVCDERGNTHVSGSGIHPAYAICTKCGYRP